MPNFQSFKSFKSFKSFQTFHYPRIAVLLAALLSTGVTWAASSASSASSAASESIGSSSTSLEKSSTSSSTNNQVAQGTYTVIETVAVADNPALLQLQLQQREDASNKLMLKVPRETIERAQIQTGSLVDVAHRPYGLAFSTASDSAASASASTSVEAKPFFLVLHDDWYKELHTRPVTLVTL